MFAVQNAPSSVRRYGNRISQNRFDDTSKSANRIPRKYQANDAQLFHVHAYFIANDKRSVFYTVSCEMKNWNWILKMSVVHFMAFARNLKFFPMILWIKYFKRS